jgi:hypothetical protein
MNALVKGASGMMQELILHAGVLSLNVLCSLPLVRLMIEDNLSLTAGEW